LNRNFGFPLPVAATARTIQKRAPELADAVLGRAEPLDKSYDFMRRLAATVTRVGAAAS